VILLDIRGNVANQGKRGYTTVLLDTVLVDGL
jgi:hypothetical protein